MEGWAEPHKVNLYIRELKDEQSAATLTEVREKCFKWNRLADPSPWR